ncbi:MAG: hypothetical protein AAFR79_20095 [Pseudomonadota bacterium]
MTRHGRPALLGALLCFAAYFANVAMGAMRMQPPLGDVPEMLMLFVSVILFVAGVLAREAETKATNDPK